MALTNRGTDGEYMVAYEWLLLFYGCLHFILTEWLLTNGCIRMVENILTIW
jgi:hypothetical protein